MLEAAGGGGGGTDWWGMSMETIQQLAQSPDVDLQYQIVDGWQKSAQLVGEHMFQVQQYRDSLATAWPPEKSTAAAAYITRLDALIKHLKETYEAALSNHEAMSSASFSLGLAKSEMNKLYTQWDTNNKTLLAYNQQQQQQKAKAASGQPTPSPSPSGDEPPPVTASQQEALRQKAITLMSSVSSDLAQAQLKVVRPAQYQPIQDFGRKDPATTGGANNAATLPPIVPTAYSASGGTPSDSSYKPAHAAGKFVTAPGDMLPPGSAFPGGGGGNPGLVLGGTTPPSTPPTIMPTPNPITPPPGGGGPTINPAPMPPSIGPVVPNATMPTGGGFPTGKSGRIKPFDGIPGEGPKAMPPGGIIGRTPTGGVVGEPATSRPGPQRVNPVGGMIGEPNMGPGAIGGNRGAVASARGSGSTASNGSRNGSLAQSYGQAARSQNRRRGESDDMAWDPDNPWVTREGVDPVVLPPAEQRIEPGPAIGLS
jgi:hypothetical protein